MTVSFTARSSDENLLVVCLWLWKHSCQWLLHNQALLTQRAYIMATEDQSEQSLANHCHLRKRVFLALTRGFFCAKFAVCDHAALRSLACRCCLKLERKERERQRHWKKKVKQSLCWTAVGCRSRRSRNTRSTVLWFFARQNASHSNMHAAQLLHGESSE